MKKQNQSMLFVVGGAVAGLVCAALVANYSPASSAATLPLLAIVFGYAGGYVGAKLYPHFS